MFSIKFPDRPLKTARSIRALFAAALVLPVTNSWAFSEDIADIEHGFHSTYHYEMTRTLAYAAGFNAQDAERIAQASSATDAFQMQGSDPSVEGATKILGTERGTGSSTSAYFHWPRRGADNATGEYEYKGGRDECRYFSATEQACADGPEIDQIERWAVYGEDALTLPVPRISVNGSPYSDIGAGSLDALGVYLHGLADSYSHEKCMQKGIRGHGGHFGANVCGPAYWHWIQEYGQPDSALGVTTTRESIIAMWQALKFYRQVNGYTEPARWNDAQLGKFKVRWTTLPDPASRKRFAIRAMKRLIDKNQEGGEG